MNNDLSQNESLAPRPVDGYWYHATTRASAKKVSIEGLKTSWARLPSPMGSASIGNFGSGKFGHESRGRIYFSNSTDGGSDYYGDIIQRNKKKKYGKLPRMVTLRVRHEDVRMRLDKHSKDDGFVTKTVKPSKIQIKDGDSDWRNIRDVFSPKKNEAMDVLNRISEVLTEMSLSRALAHAGHSEFGIISPERAWMSKDEKEEAMDRLKDRLREMRLGFSEVKGEYKYDNGVVAHEGSLFVPRATKKQMTLLCKEFDQESVIYGNNGKIIGIDQNGKQTEWSSGWNDITLSPGDAPKTKIGKHAFSFLGRAIRNIPKAPLKKYKDGHWITTHKGRHVFVPKDGSLVQAVRKTVMSVHERYGGAAKERGIWYHGTRPSNLQSILSQGLIPDPKKRAWDTDPDASFNTVSRVSYGGVYVTKNLITATSAATNNKAGGSHKDGAVVAIIELQPRSLVGDEDDFTGRVASIQPKGLIANPPSTLLQWWMYINYGDKNAEMDTWVEQGKDKYVKDSLESVGYKLSNMDGRLRQGVVEILRKEGFMAALTRMISHMKYDSTWKQAYSDTQPREKRAEAYDNAPPPPKDGETVFRKFVDRLTRTLKNVVRREEETWVSGRSLEPIRYSGSNKIVAVVHVRKPTSDEMETAKKILADKGRESGFSEHTDMVDLKYGDIVDLKYGTLPPRFIHDWKDRKSKNLFVRDGAKIALL